MTNARKEMKGLWRDSLDLTEVIADLSENVTLV
jgi:hypothetical protein